MNLRFHYLPYRRKFRQPLVTAHGNWEFREGLVVRLEDGEGRVGFGEIAPLTSFGTETTEEALRWCREQAETLSLPFSAPPGLPCCRFALASAFSQLQGQAKSRMFSVAALVGSGHSLNEKMDAGFSTFKIKVGVASFQEELQWIDPWISRLRAGDQLRLDANGGLSEADTALWLEYLEGKPVDYFEQPLAPGLENRMLEMAEPFSTPLALDESVSQAESLGRWRNWPGRLVVKPALLGDLPETLPLRAVGSSVFETAFGFEASLQFLAACQPAESAIGFDTVSLLEPDGWSLHKVGAQLQAGVVQVEQLQALWEEKQ